MAGDGEWSGPLRDTAEASTVLARHEAFRGRVWSVVSDDIVLPGGAMATRDVVDHPGAVGVVVLDEADRVLLIRQYRYPAGGYLLELPAGLRDVPGEHPLLTAQRELAEEAGLAATEWHVLVDFYNSPGGSTEAFRCFLARGVTPLEGGRTQTGEAEEADLPQAWIGLDEAVAAVLRGDLHNPTTVTGILAASAARDRAWTTLRPADDPMWALPPA